MNSSEFFHAVNAKMRGWGYDVEEQEGAWSRSNGFAWVAGVPQAHTNHHFMIPLSAPLEVTFENVTYGDSSLSGPKANYAGGIDADTGRQRLRFISAGPANHAGRGRVDVRNRMLNGQDPYGWVAETYSPVADDWSAGNTTYCGTEWHHPGDATPWSDLFIDLVVALNTAMCIVAGWSACRCHQHAEHSGRKVDMSYLRGQGGHEIRRRIRVRLQYPSGVPIPDENAWLNMSAESNIMDAINQIPVNVWMKSITQEGANVILAEIQGGVAAAVAQLTADALIAANPQGARFGAVQDDQTGAVYAVAPGTFWHIPTTELIDAARAAGLLDGDVHHTNTEGAARLRAMAAGGISPIYIPPPPPATWTVSKGDTLISISAAAGVTVRDLVAWNQLADPNSITVGQVLRLTP